MRAEQESDSLRGDHYVIRDGYQKKLFISLLKSYAMVKGLLSNRIGCRRPR